MGAIGEPRREIVIPVPDEPATPEVVPEPAVPPEDPVRRTPVPAGA